MAFESRNRQVRTWDRWTPERSQERHIIDGIGEVRAFVQVDKEEIDRIQFTSTFHFTADGKTLTSTSWLFFPDLETIGEAIKKAGMTVETVFGDWDRSPFTATKTEMIVVASIDN